MNEIEQMLANVKAAVKKKNISAGQMMLGEIIISLEAVDPSRVVDSNITGAMPSAKVISYRGYYEQLAIEPGEEPATVGALLAALKAAVGGRFEGYKGGDFYMHRDTPVWVSGYGDVSGLAVVRVDVGETVRLHLEDIDQ